MTALLIFPLLVVLTEVLWRVHGVPLGDGRPLLVRVVPLPHLRRRVVEVQVGEGPAELAQVPAGFGPVRANRHRHVGRVAVGAGVVQRVVVVVEHALPAAAHARRRRAAGQLLGLARRPVGLGAPVA